MVEDIDLRYLDESWLRNLSDAATQVLDKVDKEASKTGQLNADNLQMASLCGGFLYLYHLAQSHQIIHSSDNKTVH
jgi:hypothetical protein|tara:strand:- start:857 stop:1084 length:228 start_codon:yes stop_codon:yes gene_type:complete